LSIGAAACVKFFQKQFIFGLEVCLLALAVAVPMLAQTQPRTPSTTYIITNIQFQGNRRVHNDTLQSRIFSRKGDVYTEDGARRDFQALWNTQFFEDIRMEVEDDPAVPNGKILVFYVQERPVIRKIEYKGIKSISESDILPDGGKPVRSHSDQARGSGAERAVGRTRPSICHGQADLRKVGRFQRRQIGIQYRRRP
jgi:outer membrane protein assembly factor BamA